MTTSATTSQAALGATPASALTAAQRVFGTTELLEMILLAVFSTPYSKPWELSTVLCSQRVSKDFRSTVRGSPALSRTLYFAHDDSHAQSSVEFPSINPLLGSSIMKEAGAMPVTFYFNRPSLIEGDVDRLYFDATDYALQEGADGAESWKRMLLAHSIRSTFTVKLVVFRDEKYVVHFNVRSDITVGKFLERGRRALRMVYPLAHW